MGPGPHRNMIKSSFAFEITFLRCGRHPQCAAGQRRLAVNKPLLICKNRALAKYTPNIHAAHIQKHIFLSWCNLYIWLTYNWLSGCSFDNEMSYFFLAVGVSLVRRFHLSITSITFIMPSLSGQNGLCYYQLHRPIHHGLWARVCCTKYHRLMTISLIMSKNSSNILCKRKTKMKVA